MRYRFTLFILAIFVVSAFAQTDLVIKKELVQGRESFAVRGVGRVLARFYGYRPGLGSPEKRAYNFAARLSQLAAMAVDSADSKFYAGFKGDKTVIAYGHHVICEITREEAEANNSKELKLARDWLENIRYYLASFPQQSKQLKSTAKRSLPAVGRARIYTPPIVSDDYVIAHRSLPIGSRVRVINLFNRWSMIALVGDHQVPTGDYLVGLAPNTARALGLDDDSAIQVRLERAL